MEISIQLKEIIEKKCKINVANNRRSFVWNSEIFMAMFENLFNKKEFKMFPGIISLTYKNNVFPNEESLRKNNGISKLFENSFVNDGLQRLTSLQIVLIALKNFVNSNKKTNAIFNDFNFRNMENVMFLNSNRNDVTTLKELNENKKSFDFENNSLINHEILDCYLKVFGIMSKWLFENNNEMFMNLVVKMNEMELRVIDFDNNDSIISLHRKNNTFSNEKNFLTQFSAYLIGEMSKSFGDENNKMKLLKSNLDLERLGFNMEIDFQNKFARSFFLEICDSDVSLNSTSTFSLLLQAIQKIEEKKYNLNSDYLVSISQELKNSAVFFDHLNLSLDFSLEQQKNDKVIITNNSMQSIDITDILKLVRYYFTVDVDTDFSEINALMQIVYKQWLIQNIYSDEFIVFLCMLNISLLRSWIFKAKNSWTYSFNKFKSQVDGRQGLDFRVKSQNNINMYLTFYEWSSNYFDDKFYSYKLISYAKNDDKFDELMLEIVKTINMNHINREGLLALYLFDDMITSFNLDDWNNLVNNISSFNTIKATSLIEKISKDELINCDFETKMVNYYFFKRIYYELPNGDITHPEFDLFFDKLRFTNIEKQWFVSKIDKKFGKKSPFLRNTNDAKHIDMRTKSIKEMLSFNSSKMFDFANFVLRNKE